MAFTEDKKYAPRAKDAKQREFEEFNGKRLTTVETVNMLGGTKKDGTKKRSFQEYVLNGAYRLVVIPAGDSGCRVIIQQVTKEGVAP